MRTETRAVHPDPSDEVSLPADAEPQPATRRIPKHFCIGMVHFHRRQTQKSATR